ncbi:MAG: aminotransferase class I/II-fold pyridoxal phosphate-dependent enzyme [Oscillospiraceae bacterium]|nr:aminotransferase class I/II-fold pyridoxal phosphate-dependent enzyme [Oscillospiraceae bacterium]
MNTPVYDFLERYAGSGTVRAHMPGHKGRTPSGCGFGAAFPYDITEIKGADSLYESEGIIAESEKNASALFGTAATFYSAGGSTLCIQAMLTAVCGKGGSFICGRNAHRSVLNSCVLLGLDPLWLYPGYEDGSVVSGKITAASVEKAIECYRDKNPACVFITSPDYLGRLAPVAEIAEVCHKNGLPLLVDNAHGAYLAFMEDSLHPVALGADMCCDSAHKTLPVLTGGAYLHAANERFVPELKRNMALFGSTSPSYLIMASMDLCNKYLAEDFRSDLAETMKRVSDLKKRLVHLVVPDTEPLKVTFYAYPCGLRGYQLAEQLRENGIEAEYADETHAVLMFSASSAEEDFSKTFFAAERLMCPRILLRPPQIEITEAVRAMSPREAFFAERETIPAEKASGRIAAESVTVCPPCIPIAAAGEIIDENIIKILKMYSIFHVNVVQ